MVRSGSPVVPKLRRLSRFQQAFIALLLLAFAVRLGYALDTWRFVPVQDAHSYDWLGRGLANGHGWVMGTSAYRPPGYPFFLGAVYSIIGVPQTTYDHVLSHFGGWTGLRLVQAALGTVTVGLMGWLALQLAGRRAALVTMLVTAIYLPLIVVGVSMMTESLLVPLELAAVNFAVRARCGGERRWVVLAGVFAGLAGLTRGNGVVIGIGLAFVVWTAMPRRSLRSLTSPALLLAAMVLTIMPWTIRNAIAQHAFIPVTTELGATLSGTYNSTAAKHHYRWEAGFLYHDYRRIRHDKQLSEADRSAKLTSAVLHYIGNHPTAVPATMFWNTVRLLDLESRTTSRQTAARDVGATANVADLTVYSFWAVGLLALVGIVSAAARRIPRALWLVPLLLWISEAPITTGTPRFRAALDPWFILLAGTGILALATRATSSVLSRRRVVSGPAEGAA